MNLPSNRAQVEFLTHIQVSLSEGGFTASYKFALLLALADKAVEMADYVVRPRCPETETRGAERVRSGGPRPS